MFNNKYNISMELIWVEEQITRNKVNKALFIDYFTSNDSSLQDDMELFQYLENEETNSQLDDEDDDDYDDKKYISKENNHHRVNSNDMNSMETISIDQTEAVNNTNISALWKAYLMYKDVNYTTEKYYISKKLARQAVAEKVIRVISEEDYNNYIR